MTKCTISQKICAQDQCNIFGERWRECGYKRERKRGVYKRTDAIREMWRKIGSSNKGKKRTQEQKDRRSEVLMGRPSATKGRSHTEETREKMRTSQRRRRKREMKP